MRTQPQSPETLRAEARILGIAGVMLLIAAFPVTLVLVVQALWQESASPFLPAAVGAPPIVLGYLACHFASRRMVKAKALEGSH